MAPTPTWTAADDARIKARLEQQLADLDAALLKLDVAGEASAPPSYAARRYRARIAHRLDTCRDFYSVAGLSGENGWAPAVRDLVRQCEFWAGRLAPVERVSAKLVAA